MLKLGFKNQSQKRSQGLTFSPLPETRSGKLLPLAFSLFFIFFLLNAIPVFAASVTLTWDAPTTNSDTTPLTDLSGYRVYMSTTSGQYNSGNIVKNNIPASSSTGGVTETTTVDNLTNGTYYFIVTAYDIYGNESGNSNEIQKTTTGGDTQAPTVPTGLSAQAISSSQINLSWAASTDNVGVTGYSIYRDGALIDTSATNSYSNIGLSASTTYTYRVSAYDTAGNMSSQSSSASATTSSGGGPQQTTSAGDTEISGGGCGFIKGGSDRTHSDKGQFAMNMVMLFLSLLIIRIWRLWRPKWATLFMFCMFLLLPNVASAAVNLPWSTTYNCSDWTQSNGLQTVNCDGLRGEGGWTCDNGAGTVREEQITAAANYSGGGGGKGQRHWLGDGVNNVSGGLAAAFQSSQSELWVRWYMRYEQGFEWNPYLGNQKILYFDPTAFPRLIVEYYGQDRVQIYSYASGQGYPSVGNGWNTIMANGGTDARGNKTSDGQWHLWEFHVKMDTNGSNGVLELWIDNNKVIDVNNANLAAAPLSSLLIGSNGFTPGNGRCMYVDYDDIVIRPTGPIGGSMPDKLAPSPANGLW